MCRKPIYFKGFHAFEEAWSEEAWENKCADFYSRAIDESFEESAEMAEAFPRWRKKIMRSLIEDIIDIEKTYNFLKFWNVNAEEIEEILLYSEEYFSDRHMRKCGWNDEPVKKWATRYPQITGSTHVSGKRNRARVDPFEQFTIYLLI